MLLTQEQRLKRIWWRDGLDKNKKRKRDWLLVASVDPGKLVMVRPILELVSAHYKVTTRQVLGYSRMKRATKARKIIYYIARQLTGYSYPRIGAQLGGRDHTTLVKVLRDLERDMAADHALAAEVNLLLDKCKMIGATQ